MMRMEFNNAVTVGVGLMFIGAGLYMFYSYRSFAARSRETEAVVTEVEVRSSTKSTHYYATVRFTTAEGKEVVTTVTEFKTVGAGQKVRLCYLPERPEEPSIGSLSDLRKQGIGSLVLCAIFGTVVCLIGLGLEFGYLGKPSEPGR